MAFRCWYPADPRAAAVLAAGLLGLLAGCKGPPAKNPAPAPTPPTATARKPAPEPPFAVPVIGAHGGDEIAVAGRLFHTGTRVVLWCDPGGYNAYNGPVPAARRPMAGRDRNDLAALRGLVDEFVLHYDACGLSRICFEALHSRGLSVHFLLDLDGTIYQTLDLRERAAHATTANDRSIGVEIANIGAFAPGDRKLLNLWYHRDRAGRLAVRIPPGAGEPRLATRNFVARPARPELIHGSLQGRELVQYDYTPEQYAALAKLTAALCTVFPELRCDFPHDAAGRLVTRKLPDGELKDFRGILGHWHVQENKEDPGPALQWGKLIREAEAALGTKR